jgi:hypothetical protein
MSSKVPPAQPPVPGEPQVVSQPQPPVDALHRPFVGNETIDDNLRESVKVAIWNVMGDRERGLEITVTAGVATLSGPVVDRAEAALVRKAAMSISGIADVIERLVPAGGPAKARRPDSAPAVAPQATPSTKMVSLTRFCGLDDASTGAAIRQAVGRLDHFFAERKLPAPEALIIVYRNLIPGAITLELGFPVPAHGEPRTEGEFNIAELPVAAEQVAVTTPGLAPIIVTLRDLMQAGHGFAWQVLVSEEFRPWRGHPALPLNVARGM